ncbi:hypothetical protein KCU99_g3281, partial [Aureobasidium melanogenum]
MAEEKLSHFREQMPGEDGAPLVDQQILDQIITGASSVNPEQQDAASPPRQSSEPAQQSSQPGLQSAEPVDGQAPPAESSSTGPSEGCKGCGQQLVCTCSPVRETQSAPTSADHSPTRTQGQASTASAPLPDVNVPTSGPAHIRFEDPVNNRTEASTNATPLLVLATGPDHPQVRYAAAQRRVDLANIAVDAALTHSIYAHVNLRLAQANANYANTSNHDQAHDALANAQRAISHADDAWLESQLELLQAHVARHHAESDARHAGYAYASNSLSALQQGIPGQELDSDLQQQTSQNDGDQQKERWKGKGRAVSFESSSADQQKKTLKGKDKAEKPDSSSAASKRTLIPFKIVKRVFRRGLPNEQPSPQKPERSQSEPTLQPSIPTHNASSSQPADQKLVIANGSGTDKNGSGSGNVGASESKKKDGAEDGNPDGTQVSEDTRKAEETGNPQSPDSSTSPGHNTSPDNLQTPGTSPDNSTSPNDIPPGGDGSIPPGGDGSIPPGGDGSIPPDGTGKKPGLLRKMSSDLLSKMKTKK